MWWRIALVLLAGSVGCVIPVESWVDEGNYIDNSWIEDRGSETSLAARVNLGVGELQIQPGAPGKTYELEVHYSENGLEPSVEFERQESGRAELQVGLEGKGHGSFRHMGENLIRLRLNPDLPLDLRAETGVGESTIDLTGMDVQSLIIQSGVGETKVSMLELNKGKCERIDVTSGVGALEVVGLGNFAFDRLHFRGGVGGTRLEFSGQWEHVGETEIEVGVGGVEILFPRDVGVEVSVSKGLFAEFSVPDGFTKRGDTYYSDNADRVSKVLKLRVRAGIGGVEVKWL